MKNKNILFVIIIILIIILIIFIIYSNVIFEKYSVENIPIDIVYTWVESNEEFEKEKSYWLEKTNKEDIKNKENSGSIRFKDNKEIMYSLRSIEKYFPNYNNIYIIVKDGQFPKYLKKDHPKIKIVNHFKNRGALALGIAICLQFGLAGGAAAFVGLFTEPRLLYGFVWLTCICLALAAVSFWILERIEPKS